VVVKPFKLIRPDTVEEATAALAEHGADARVMAGGQSLLKKMKTRTVAPAVIVAVDRIAQLRARGTDGDSAVVLGAASTYRSISADTGLRARQPLLPLVAGDLADVAVRTMGTIGGSLCEADPVFDMPVLCSTLHVELVIMSRRGTRTIDAGEFVTGAYRTVLNADEMLTELRFPAAGPRTGTAFRKVRFRRFDAATASVGCSLALAEDGTVHQARLVVGAVTAVPAAVDAVAQMLVGTRLTAASASEAARVVQDAVRPDHTAPFASAAYKRELLGPLVRSALLDARAAAGQEED
jgi:aerobic carbon-monoxide dehydrogenase medium subunit